MSDGSLVNPDVFDHGHYASTAFKKLDRSLHLGPKYFLWDLPGYFFDRVGTGP